LGPKIARVPFIIGVNWAILTLVTGAVAAVFIKRPWLVVVVAALLMTGLDYFMEPVAGENGYWFWKGGKIPLYNYVCWFLVALLAQGINVGISKTKANNTTWVLFFALILFFVIQFYF
jgi:putative membrane protein